MIIGNGRRVAQIQRVATNLHRGINTMKMTAQATKYFNFEGLQMNSKNIISGGQNNSQIIGNQMSSRSYGTVAPS